MFIVIFRLFKKFSTLSGFQIKASLRRCKGDMTKKRWAVAGCETLWT